MRVCVCVCVCVYIYIRGDQSQSQVESYQRLKKWYLMPPCFTLNIKMYWSMAKWSNPGKGLAPFPTPRCSICNIEKVAFELPSIMVATINIYIVNIYIYIYIYIYFVYIYIHLLYIYIIIIIIIMSRYTHNLSS